MRKLTKLFRWGVFIWFIFLGFNLHAQQISLKYTNTPLKTVLKSIENQSDFTFVYSNALAGVDSNVSITVENESVEAVLKTLFDSVGIVYKVTENQIILSSEDIVPPSESTEGAGQAGKQEPSPSQSSSKTITGTVIATDDGLPLIGVTIKANGATAIASTDANGRFSITVPADVKHLTVSYVGFQTTEINVSSRSVVNVELEPEATMLSEVVVTTGYITEKKKNVSGAVASVSSKDLQMAKVDNVQRALEGKAAGVQIVSANGLPGAAVNINIRGKSSISAGLTPLYIIDGVQVTTGSFASVVQTSNVMAGINPDDIESIDILKDAATASIYGAQAANGVIIIKTKRGSQGKPKISFSSKLGIDNLVNNIDLLNSQQFIELSLLTFYNRYGGSNSNFLTPFNNYASRGWITSTPDQFPGVLTFNDAAIPNDDWYKSIYRTGFTQEYQLSISGGNEFVKAYISGSLNKSQSSMVYTNFDRFTMRANVDFNVTKWLDVSTSTIFGNTSQRMPKDGGVIASPPRGVLNMIPYNKIYNDDGTLNTANLEGAQHTHPLQAAELNIYKLKTNKLTHNTDFTFKFLRDFTFKVSGKVDYNTLDEQNYLDPRTPQGVAYEGYAEAAHDRIMNIQTSEVLNYVKSLNNGVHRINALLGFEYKDYERRVLGVSATGFPTPDFKLLSQAGTIDSYRQTFTGYKMIGTFARLGYTLKDKYIVNLVVRRDGSSRFGENQKWGVFPSASAAWRVGDEKFIRDNISWINDLKLKVSYGLTGNSDIGNFIANPQFAGSGRYDGISGIAPSIPGNLDLTWETKYSTNIGIDFSIFNDRFAVTLDYFNDKTKDLLYNRTVPINSGYTAIYQNVGSVRNEGIELSFTATPVRTKGFTWTVSPNFTWLKNRILSLVDGKDKIGTSLVVGKPIDNFYVYDFAGVNPADGRPMWYSKEGYITYSPTADDRKYVNGLYPTFYGGVSNTLTWKGFDLSFLFQFQTGARRYNADKVQLSRVGNTNDRNQYVKMYEDYWRTPGQITDVAQPMADNTYIGPGGKTRSYSAASSLHYDSTDFLKLKNISLSYTFPRAIANKVGLQGLSLACNAFNLWTTTKYTGYDPEFTGSDEGTYPQSRTITFVLKLDL